MLLNKLSLLTSSGKPSPSLTLQKRSLFRRLSSRCSPDHT